MPMEKYIYTVVPLFYKATPTKSHTSFMSCQARFQMHLDSKILVVPSRETIPYKTTFS